MKSDLKNLASQEEIYYSDTYEYSNVVASLGFVSSSGVTVTITGGTGRLVGYGHARAALAATDGCAIYYGNAAAVSLGLVPGHSPLLPSLSLLLLPPSLPPLSKLF